jgi:prepilin-type N-terminal cleavage/methylation domain-containing protein
MRHKMLRSAGRRGFTLVEVGVAIFIVTVVALAGFAYYGTARVTEINEWHEQNALFNCEREVEAWQENGYSGIAGFTAADCGPANYLPYGYRFGVPDAAWNQAGRYKEVILDGFTYRIRAQNIFTANVGDDYYVAANWAGIDYYYREVVVTAQWGGFTGFTSTFDMQQTTRMAR